MSNRAVPENNQAADTNKSLLSANHLACTTAGRTLWRNLDLVLRGGERRAVVGPSGSGKTMLLRCLAGLTSPTTGDIRFAGRALSDWSMPAYRARVTYVPQRPALAEGRVSDALAAPFRLRVHRYMEYDEASVLWWLDVLELRPEFLDQACEKLSGGEAQIVAMLRALSIAPTILLLDEPTASLDGMRVECVENLIREWLAEDAQRAYLWSSHDRAQLERVSDQRLTLGAAEVGWTAS